MRNGAERNKRTVWYALYEGTTEIVDSDGNKTGERLPVYGKVRAMRVNISGTSGLTNNNLSGKVEYQPYGQQNMYVMTLNPLPPDCLIDEMSVFWVDTKPVLKEDGTTDTPYDHVIYRIAGSLNWRACQITRVQRGR
nr:MAG TPA: hypothetical protein [Caudoviricetes sp.]